MGIRVLIFGTKKEIGISHTTVAKADMIPTKILYGKGKALSLH